MKTVIYYFSGTGNSLKVARDLASKIEDSIVYSIPVAMEENRELPADKVGIIFPVYAWGMPMIVKKFIARFKDNDPRYFFSVATCGGSSAGTLQQVANFMKSKGIKLSAGFSVQMPTNYIVWGDAISEERQKAMFVQWEKRLEDIAATIAKGESCPVEKDSAFANLFLTGVAYKLSMPNFAKMDRSFRVDEKCNHCGVCFRICPVRNIEMKDGKPEWKHKCEQCLACIQWCPKEAIQYGSKTAVRKRYQNPDTKLKDFFIRDI